MPEEQGQQKSWYETGYGGIGREEERLSSMSGPFRIWIAPGKQIESVLIDDEPFAIYEHQFRMNDSWRNWYTCLKGVDEPVCCQVGGEKSRSYVGYMTAINCTETVDKKGNKYQYELQLLGGKLKTLKKWRRKKEERGALAYCRWRLTREDDKSPVCGDEFEFLSEVKDPAKLFEVANYRGKKLSELWDKAEANPESMERLKKIFKVEFNPEDDGRLVRRVVPFNYFDQLRPRTAKEMREIFQVSKPQAASDEGGGGSGGGAGGKADESVPF